MSPLENIVDAIQNLSQEEKCKLRLLLDEECGVRSTPANIGVDRSKRIIGLFADEPEVMDRAMEAVYESRSRPLRHIP